MVKPKRDIGKGRFPFSKPATETPERQLFPQFLKTKQASSVPEIASARWVPPLTRIEPAQAQPAAPFQSSRGAGIQLPDFRDHTAVTTTTSEEVYEVTEESTPPLTEPLFSTTFKLHSFDMRAESRYLSGLDLVVATAFDEASEKTRTLQSAAEQHGVIARAKRSRGQLHISVRATAPSLGEAEMQILSFAQALGTHIELKLSQPNKARIDPRSRPEVFAIRSAVSDLGVRGATIEVKKRAITSGVAGSLKIQLTPPAKDDQVAIQRFDQALSTLQVSLRRLNRRLLPTENGFETKTAWVPREIQTRNRLGLRLKEPFLLLEAEDFDVNDLTIDAEARLPALLQHWGILVDGFSAWPAQPASQITASLAASLSAKSLKQILTAESKFPKFEPEQMREQFSSLASLVEQLSPQALEQNLKLGSYAQAPFIHQALERALRTNDPQFWERIHLDVRGAEELAVAQIATTINDPAQIERFVQDQLATGTYEGFVSALIYSAAIEPRRHAHQDKSELLVLAQQWEDGMRPIVTSDRVLASEPEVRWAIELYLLNFGVSSSFIFDRTRFSFASRMLSTDSAKPGAVVTPAQAGSLLDAPHVINTAELDALNSLTEQAIERSLGMGLFLFKQLAAEAGRGDALFYL